MQSERHLLAVDWGAWPEYYSSIPRNEPILSVALSHGDNGFVDLRVFVIPNCNRKSHLKQFFSSIWAIAITVELRASFEK
jgi:hypothetical protein